MKVSPRQNAPQNPKGFTLFELVLALGIAGMVLTSIFKIADGSVRATSKMVDIQNEDITRDAFFSFLRNHFDSLPGNAVFNLVNTSNTEPFTSELTFQNTPVSFNWGGVPISAQATRLITIPTVSGGLDVVLEYYDVPILDSDEAPAERGIDPIATVTLLNDVRLFEWSVLDVRNYDSTERDEWPYEWDQNTRPSYVELTVVFENGDRRIKRLFWIPKKTNPRTTMSALQNKARGARQSLGGQTGGGGQGDRPTGGGGDQGDRPTGGGNQRDRPTGVGGGGAGGGRGGATTGAPGGGGR